MHCLRERVSALEEFELGDTRIWSRVGFACVQGDSAVRVACGTAMVCVGVDGGRAKQRWEAGG